MIRLTLALAAWIGLASVGGATLTPPKAPLPFGKELPQAMRSRIAAPELNQATGQSARPEFVLTRRTQVLLNGKPCTYEAIPPRASVVFLELAPDRKTVLKIHFRTR